MATAEGVGVLPERPDGSKPTTAVLTQLVSAIGVPNTQLCSRNVPGLAGETSAGNKLMRSGFHAGRKPSESDHYKPTYVGDERETEPHPHRRCRSGSQEDLPCEFNPPVFPDGYPILENLDMMPSPHL